MIKIENGIGIVKSVHLSAGEYVLPGYTHVLIEEVDFMNDIYSVKVIDDELNNEDELEWIVKAIRYAEAKRVA
jgi:hypothetical protein